MRSFMGRVSSTLALLAFAAMPAAAQGLFVKLATEEAKTAVDKPVKVRITTVVMRSFNLPEPEFLIDDGSGMKARPDIKIKAVAKASSDKVSPGTAHETSWEVELPNPGHYRLQARYKLEDRVAQSNKVSVEVTGPQAAQQQ
jgi:hypothetical protein